MKKRKWLIYVITVVLTITLASIASVFNSCTPLQDAVVNSINGNIAFAYYDSQNAGVQIIVCDHDGHKLWTRFLSSNGGSTLYLSYVEGSLQVYVSRTNKLYLFSEEGTITLELDNISSASEEISAMSLNNWNSWNQQKNGYTYYSEKYGTKYIYSDSFTVFDGRKCQLSIENSDGQMIVLYQDGTT